MLYFFYLYIPVLNLDFLRINNLLWHINMFDIVLLFIEEEKRDKIEVDIFLSIKPVIWIRELF